MFGLAQCIKLSPGVASWQKQGFWTRRGEENPTKKPQPDIN